MLTVSDRLQRARLSLEGLSVGDALGGFFEFSNSQALSHHVRMRTIPDVKTYRFTDDTNMALSIYDNLRLYEQIRQDELALSFATHFDRGRGYGPSIRRFAPLVLAGKDWREAALSVFGGQGSLGNGGAMRVAPVGAYFADDLDAVVKQARRSCEVTHAHPEGIAGAVAVAVAAALAFQLRDTVLSRQAFIERILPYIPASQVLDGCQNAANLPASSTVDDAVKQLGNGSRVTAQDTVPFVLWCAGEKMNSYPDAIWLTASGGGDVDTTCAMVGGIVALYTGYEGIPSEWLARREPLPTWALGNTV